MKEADEEYKVLIFKDEATGHVTYEEWCLPGHGRRRHRIDAPAVRRFDPKNGRLLSEEYFRNGIGCNNGSAPHSRSWNPASGHLECEIWVDDQGRGHRDGGLPAHRYYYPKSGKLQEEVFYHHGKIPDDGPSRIRYDARSGKIVSQQFNPSASGNPASPSPPDIEP